MFFYAFFQIAIQSYYRVMQLIFGFVILLL